MAKTSKKVSKTSSKTSSKKPTSQASLSKTVKKVAAKVAGKVVKKVRQDRTALHDTLIKMFKRPNGATLREIKDAGYDYAPGIFALRIAETRGYKIKVVKKEGERARYCAFGSATT